MNKKLYWLLADFIFVIHIAVVYIILFGWYHERYHTVYLFTLITTLLSEVILGYCILTKWEFDLRKKVKPELAYDSNFMSYYVHKFFKLNLPKQYIKYPALVFLIVSILLTLK